MLDLTLLINLNQLAQASTVFWLVAVCAAQPLLWVMVGWYVAVFVWHKRGGFIELAAISSGAILGYAVKIVLGWWWLRPRPFVVGFTQLLITQPWDAQSFPSGHAMFAFFLATLLYLHRKRWWWAYLLATLVALGRVVVGVHYPSDVLAGAIIGVVFGLLTTRLERHARNLKRA